MRRASTTRTWIVCLLTALALTIADTRAAEAQDAPPYLSHQGRLFDADNQPVTGVMELAFRLYDGPDTDAVELWSETLSVNVANGYYTVTLGQQSALPQGLFNGEQRHLGVTVTSEGAELAPRLALNSVAYALHAAVAENAVGDLTPRSITVGGQTLIDETGAWVAEPPALNTGFALSGDGSSGAPLAVDATAFAPVATSGSFGDLADAPDTLGGLGCTGFGELPKWDGSAWTCGVDNGEVYTAGFGLALSVAGEFGVNLGEIQARVSAVCSPGEAIQIINQDGTVTCAADQDTTYAAGAGLALDPGTNTFSVNSALIQSRVTGACAAGQAIAAIDAAGAVTCAPAVSYAAGAGLALDPATNTFSVDSAAFQARVNGACAAGQAIRVINADGSVTCEDDQDSTYIAGAGLSLSGATFSVDTTTVQARVSSSCAVGQAIRAINADGSVTCEDDTDTNTTYTAGAGLTLSGTAFALNQTTVEAYARGVAFDTEAELTAALNDNYLPSSHTPSWGSLTGIPADIADGDQDTTYSAGTGLTLSGTTLSANTAYLQRRVGGACAAGQAIRAINADGSVSCNSDSALYHRQVNNGSMSTGSYTPRRYVVDATPATVGTTVRLNLATTDALCRDDDGCDVVIAMVNWDGTGNVASRGYHLFYSQTSGSWRFENNDLDGIDNNNGLHEWGAWDCYFTDAETATTNNNGRSDSGRGFGLLNARGGSYSDATTTCRLIIQD